MIINYGRITRREFVFCIETDGVRVNGVYHVVIGDLIIVKHVILA